MFERVWLIINVLYLLVYCRFSCNYAVFACEKNVMNRLYKSGVNISA